MGFEDIENENPVADKSLDNPGDHDPSGLAIYPRRADTPDKRDQSMSDDNGRQAL